MIFATDIDRTIIFSKRFTGETDKPIVCVDRKNDREISYMTEDAFYLLNDLKKEEGLQVIPVTTRSLEQYKRVGVLQDCEYAVTTNGGIILHKGEVLKEWEDRINHIKEKRKFSKEELINSIQVIEGFCEKPFKLVDDTFYYTKIKENICKLDIKEVIVEYLEREIDKEECEYTIQGRKLYIIPKGITKENALQFLKEYLNKETLIVAGDGKLDLGMLGIGDIVLIPEGSEVLEYLEDTDIRYDKVPKGLEGVEDLLREVKNQKKRGIDIEKTRVK